MCVPFIDTLTLSTTLFGLDWPLAFIASRKKGLYIGLGLIILVWVCGMNKSLGICPMVLVCVPHVVVGTNNSGFELDEYSKN